MFLPFTFPLHPGLRPRRREFPANSLRLREAWPSARRCCGSPWTARRRCAPPRCSSWGPERTRPSEAVGLRPIRASVGWAEGKNGKGGWGIWPYDFWGQLFGGRLVGSGPKKHGQSHLMVSSFRWLTFVAQVWYGVVSSHLGFSQPLGTICLKLSTAP